MKPIKKLDFRLSNILKGISRFFVLHLLKINNFLYFDGVLGLGFII